MKSFLAYLLRVDSYWSAFSSRPDSLVESALCTYRNRKSSTWGQSLSIAIGSSILPLMSSQLVQAAPITCPQIYGSYNNGTVYNSLRTYDPLTATVGAEIAALTDGAGGTPAIAALAVDPILTTSGRRRVYYTENVNATTRLFYYDGVSVVNTGITLILPVAVNNITRSDGTLATSNNSFNRMAFAPDGTLYIADGQKTFYRFSPDRFGTGGTLSAATTIVDNANNDSGNSFRAQVGKSAGGDITFDNQGRMYIVTYDANTSNVPTEFRLFQVLNPTVASPQAVLLGKQPTTDPVAGLTFSSGDNKLYMQGTGGKSFSWDLGLNSVATLTQVSPGSADLSSCTYPNLDPVNTVTKTVANITNPAATALSANDILEYTISISNTGNLVAGNATLLDLIPGGSTYLVGSTKLNGTTLTDGAGSTMPYANSVTLKPINSPGQASGVLLAGAANKATVVFRVRVTTSNTKVCNQGIFKYDGGPANGLFSDDPTTTQMADTTCIGTVAIVSNPLTCGLIYGSYTTGTVFNSLRTYDPLTSTVGTAIAALTDGAGGTPPIAALSVDPILDTNGRRRIYYTENVNATVPRLFYYDGVTVVNTGVTLTLTTTTNNVTRSDGTTATGGNTFNRMGFAPDGTLYIADGQKTFYRFIPNRGGTGGSLSAAITISDNANNDAGNSFRAQVGKSAGGDITFDNQGRMYIVTYDANTSNVPTEFRLFQIFDPTTSTPQAVLLGRSPSTDPVAGLTFSASDNKLYMQGSGGKSFSWDLGTNALATLTTVIPGSADLGGCNYPNLNPMSDASTVQKTVTNITNPTATALAANDILEYKIEITNTGNLAAGNATLVDLIPSGSTYAAASTKLNNIAVTDGAGITMPYANNTTPKPINTLGQASGVLLTGAANKATVVFRVKVNASNIRICNQGTYKYDGGPTNGILTDNSGTANLLGDSTCIGRTATNANVSIIKRITAINGLTTNSIDNTDLSLPDNTIPNWPTNYLKGATNGGKVKPGDEIEYTIYFLNDGGGNANSVRICDRINPNQTLQTTTYGTPNLGMKLQLGALTNAPTNLTTINDPTIDRAQFIAAGGAVPTDCHLPGINDNGTAMLDLTGTTGSPSLTTLSNNAYGFWRFTTKVNISP
jgi:uncharacterized repeat protein (TIGR01451 family)